MTGAQLTEGTAWIAANPDGPWTPLRGITSEPSTWTYDEAPYEPSQVAVTATWTGGYTFLMTPRERRRMLRAFGLHYGGRQLLHNGRKPTARRRRR